MIPQQPNLPTSKAYNELLSVFGDDPNNKNPSALTPLSGSLNRVPGGARAAALANAGNLERFRQLQAAGVLRGRGQALSQHARANGVSGIEAELLAAQANLGSQNQLRNVSQPKTSSASAVSRSNGAAAAAQAALAMRMARNGNATSPSNSAVHTSGSRHVANGANSTSVRASGASGANSSSSANSGSSMGASNRSGGRGGASGRPRTNGQGRVKSQLTKEQVIVGHFCRHATTMLSELLENKPNRKEMNDELCKNIRHYWAAWLHGRITKNDLLHRISSFVNKSCPEAANLNVEAEFRTWYQHQADLRAKENERIAIYQKVFFKIKEMVEREKRGEKADPEDKKALLQEQRKLRHDIEQLKQLQKVHEKMSVVKKQRIRAQRVKELAKVKEEAKVKDEAKVQEEIRVKQEVKLKEDDDDDDDDKALLAQFQPPPGRVKPLRPRIPVGANGDNNSSVSSLAGTKHQLSGSPVQAPQPKRLKTTKPAKKTSPTLSNNIYPKGVKPPPASIEKFKGASLNQTRQERVDDALKIVNNIVDIEQEEEALIGGSNAQRSGAATSIDTNKYAENMMLNGPRLRQKLQKITTRNGLGDVSLDVIEFMSLAAREHLSGMMESLRDIARARKDLGRAEWTTADVGPDVAKELESTRKHEQRSLDVAKELRKRKREEEEENAAADRAKTATGVDGKTAKELAAAAEAARKEREAIEKKREAANSTNRALHQLTAGLVRRNKKKKKKAGTTYPAWSQKSDKSTSAGSSMQTDASTSMNSVKASVNAAVAAGKTATSDAESKGITRPGDFISKIVESPICLRDCLFYMQHEHNFRASPILFRWAPRVGLRDPQFYGKRKSG